MAGNVVELSNGKFRLRVSIGSGKTRKDYSKNVIFEGKYDTGTIPKQIQKELALFVAAIEGKKVSNTKLTFKQFTENIWFPEYANRKLKQKTLYRYTELLKSRIYDSIGDIRIAKLTPSHLNKFYIMLSEPGIKKIKGKGDTADLSERTILHHHALISSILGKAVKWGYIPDNPAVKAEITRPKDIEMPFLEIEEIKIVMVAIGKEKLKYRVIAMLDIFSGMRRGELMGLEWSSIGFENNTIKIDKTSNYTKETGVYEDTVKTDKSNRVITIPPFVIQLLKAYKTEQQLYKNKKRVKGKLLDDNDKLFIQHNGKPMHPDTPTKWWPKFLKNNNLPPVNFHGLRHTNASLMMAMGFDVATGASRLGHARKETYLNTYSHMLTSKDKAVASAMEKTFNPKKKVYRLKNL
jgi:integrase